jgi:hypothetical protein
MGCSVTGDETNFSHLLQELKETVEIRNRWGED